MVRTLGLKELGIQLQVPLGPRTTYGIGGPASYFVEPKTFEQLSGCMKWAKKEGHHCHVLGGGSNTLFPDRGINGLVIRTASLVAAPELLSSGNWRYLAGFSTHQVFRHGMRMQKRGYAFLAGIPGTIGGALVMNAGTSIGTMSASVSGAAYLSCEGVVRTIGVLEMNLSYRKSNFLDSGDVVISVDFEDRGFDVGHESELAQKVLEKRKKNAAREPKELWLSL